jgi:hypothetical protein
MTDTAMELIQPDLAKGIPLSKLPDGGMMVGHAQGEPVLLARRGDEVFAISAIYTHYGVMDAVARGGIDFTDVNRVLEEEGIEKFEVSFDRLLGVIGGKRSTLAIASPPQVHAV